MTIRNLEIFVAIVECGNMSKAADKLWITQSSVSQAISEMEKEYNVLLFDRLKSGLQLTQVGQEMLKYAKNILNLINEMENVLQHESRSPKIRIGASATVGATVMRGYITDLLKEIPSEDYSVFVSNTTNIEQMLINNDLDIAIVEGECTNKDLKSEIVMDDRLVLICAPQHKFYGRAKVSLEEIAKEPLVLREIGSGTREQFLESLSEKGLHAEVKWNCNSPDIVKRAVKENLGVSVISERLVREDVEDGTLWACIIDDPNFVRTFKIIYHKDKYFTKTMKSLVKICYDRAR